MILFVMMNIEIVFYFQIIFLINESGVCLNFPKVKNVCDINDIINKIKIES